MVNGENVLKHGDDDRRLLERAVAGDSTAFDILITRHIDSFLRLAYSLVGDRPAAEDVVQETFRAALSGMRAFRGASSVKTWLVGILARQAARHRRRESIRRHAPVDEALVPAGGDSQASSDAKLDVAWALGELDEDHRRVIALRELEGMSYDEIAEALGVPRGTVESRLHRARKALAEKLEAYRG